MPEGNGGLAISIRGDTNHASSNNGERNSALVTNVRGGHGDKQNDKSSGLMIPGRSTTGRSKSPSGIGSTKTGHLASLTASQRKHKVTQEKGKTVHHISVPTAAEFKLCEDENSNNWLDDYTFPQLVNLTEQQKCFLWKHYDVHNHKHLDKKHIAVFCVHLVKRKTADFCRRYKAQHPTEVHATVVSKMMAELKYLLPGGPTSFDEAYNFMFKRFEKHFDTHKTGKPTESEFYKLWHPFAIEIFTDSKDEVAMKSCSTACVIL